MKEKSRLGAFPGGIRLSDSRRAPTQIPLAAPRNPFQLWMGAAKICLFPKSQAKKKKPEQGPEPEKAADVLWQNLQKKKRL